MDENNAWEGWQEVLDGLSLDPIKERINIATSMTWAEKDQLAQIIANDTALRLKNASSVSEGISIISDYLGDEFNAYVDPGAIFATRVFERVMYDEATDTWYGKEYEGRYGLPNVSAVDAWKMYRDAVPEPQPVSKGGANAIAAAGLMVGNVSIAEATTGAIVEVAGISISPAIAIAAVLPYLNMSMDNWNLVAETTDIVELYGALEEDMYPGTQTLPAVMDSEGQVWLSESVYDHIKAKIEELGWGAGGEGSTVTGTFSELYTSPVTVYLPGGPYRVVTGIGSDNVARSVEFTVPTGCRAVIYGQNVAMTVYFASESSEIPDTQVTAYRGDKIVGTYSTSGHSSVTHSGQTAYYTHSQGGIGQTSPLLDGVVARSSEPLPSGFSNTSPLMYLITYGDIHTASSLPDGVSEWTGVPQNITEANKMRVAMDKNGLTKPYFPIFIPAGDPTITGSPEVVPQTPSPEISPYIPVEVPQIAYPEIISQPEATPDEDERVAPLPDPLPQPQPVPTPVEDPSTVTDPDIDYRKPTPDPDTLPTDVDPPGSIGDTPLPYVPDPENWPSIIPSSSASGLVHVYNPTPAAMIEFGRWLWVTYADATIEKIWNNPFDGVIGAFELYAKPSNGYTENIRSGFLVSTAAAPTVPVRYSKINCGSIVVQEYWGNYLDYSPYTKAHIYLPFIGIVELDADDIIGHAVNVSYYVDAYNGSCIAQITVAKDFYSNTVYQFSGNCAVEVPLSGGSQAAIKAGTMQAAATGITSIIGGIASLLGGHVGSAITGVAGGLGSAMTQAVSNKSSVQHSGTFGASYGAMGIKKPYIIVRRPIQKMVYNYNLDYGFPAHKRVQIGLCTGFLRVREVNVVSATATDEEKARIEELLKEGVYVT